MAHGRKTKSSAVRRAGYDKQIEKKKKQAVKK
jgi:hypothetical protein